MSPTFTQSLETSRALQERLASTPSDEVLAQKVAMVDFATFGMFKQAWMEQAAPGLVKGLGWGVGLGVPAVGAAHIMARDARHQGEQLVNHTRNQALLTALGVGGIQGAGQALSSVLPPKDAPAPAAALPPIQQLQVYERPMSRPGLGIEELAALRGYPGLEELGGLKTSSDTCLQKLAAVVLLDNVLECQVEKLAGDERADALECLLINRSLGTRLLRELY